jgi:hypothetical protein
MRPSIVLDNRLGSRRRARYLAIAVISGALIVTQQLYAHHSFAMYDQTITRNFTGRLIQFIPGANHAQLIFEVLDAEGAVAVDESGEPLRWGIETPPAAQLARQGVTLQSFPVGTVINVTLNPLRDGRNFGALARTDSRLVSCGAAFPDGGCSAEVGTVYLDSD